MSAIESEASELHQATRPPDKTQLARYYHQMLAIRRIEEALAKAYAQRKIRRLPAPLHRPGGGRGRRDRDAQPDDYVVATYREHAHALRQGHGARKEIIAELYGKATGCSKGLGGSMHLFDAANNFLGGYGIVGGHIPLAAGVAFASKYRGDGRVTLCFFGDGAVAAGRASTRASRWRRCGSCRSSSSARTTSTRWARRSTASLSVADVSQKALGYGMARDRFDGDDVLRVRERIAEAVRRARNESLPTLDRGRAPTASAATRCRDPAKYRTKDEVEEWKKRDPICVGARAARVRARPMDEKDIVALEAEGRAEEIEEAVKFAEESPEPGLRAPRRVHVQRSNESRCRGQ